MSVDVVDAPRRRVTLDELRAHRNEIYAIASRYGVSNIRVFGSVARGEADESKDLDLLIDIAAGHSLFHGRVRSRRGGTAERLHPGRHCTWPQAEDSRSCCRVGGAPVR
jgi:hypothetical protein